MKNKILVLLILSLLAISLVNDTTLIIKVFYNPQIFSSVDSFSYIHYLLLNEYKLEFAVFKLLFTSLIFVLWSTQLFKRFLARTLTAITAYYILFFIFLLLLIATSIAGILQQSVNLPVNLLNTVNVLSTACGSYLNLLYYTSLALAPPALLLILSSLYVQSMHQTSAQQ